MDNGDYNDPRCGGPRPKAIAIAHTRAQTAAAKLASINSLSCGHRLGNIGVGGGTQ